jgi:hypothetical protein
LCMIAAGIGNDATLKSFLGKGRKLVVGATQFKRPDRLQVFRLEVQLAGVFLVPRVDV